MNKLRKSRYKFSASIGTSANSTSRFMIWLKSYKIYSEKIIVPPAEIIVDSIEPNGKKTPTKLNITRIIIAANKALLKKDKSFFIFAPIKASVVKVTVAVTNAIRTAAPCPAPK